MAIFQEYKGSQSFMVTNNVKDECFDCFNLTQDDDFFNISPISQTTPLVSVRTGFMTPTTSSTPTNNTKRKVPGDSQKPQGCKSKRFRGAEFDDFQVKEIQAYLGAECPIFVKYMLPTHVSRGFFLPVPQKFCILHMPLHDTIITLENQSGEEYRTNFLVEHRILSRGWKIFCSANKLVVGDLLVFRLIRPLKFKVYILGTHSLADVNAAFSLLKLGTCGKQTLFDYAEGNEPMALSEGITHKTRETLDNAKLLGNEYNEEFDCTVKAARFEDVRSIENFTILLNGMSIDSQLSKQDRKNYYDLCCSQSSFLHDYLLKNINGKLAAEIIKETIYIASAVRAGKLFTPHGDYAMWEKTLNAFEKLGMKVGFLRAQLRHLLSLPVKSKHAKLEQSCAIKEMRTGLEFTYLGLKDRMASVDARIQTLKEVAKTRELFFQEEDDDGAPSLW